MIRQSIALFITAVCLSLPAASFLYADALDETGVNAQAVHALGLTGQGVGIAVLSQGNARTSHACFDRPKDAQAVTAHDFTKLGLSRSEHDTNMAGLLAAMGTSKSPDMTGIAFGAQIHSARIVGGGFKPSDLMDALETLITKHHCRIIVTGVQLPADKVVPDGQSPFSMIYDYYAETYDVIFATAAGNESPKITIFGDCYNGITTAALIKDSTGVYRRVGRLSNPGPTADGRKKPELAAPSGQLLAPSAAGDDLWKTADPNSLGLTSFAVPFTAGTAALLLEAAAKNPVEHDDRSEVLKAVIVNSVTGGLIDKKGLAAADETSVSRWKPDSGYGRINALNAYNTLAAGPVGPDQPIRRKRGWAYGLMAKSGEHMYPVELEKNERLVFTVTWHRKITKTPTMLTEEPVRFTLHAKVQSPSGKTVVFETAGRNNLIKADCVAGEKGTYKIILHNPLQTQQRDYGMAFEISAQ